MDVMDVEVGEVAEGKEGAGKDIAGAEAGAEGLTLSAERAETRASSVCAAGTVAAAAAAVTATRGCSFGFARRSRTVAKAEPHAPETHVW